MELHKIMAAPLVSNECLGIKHAFFWNVLGS
jgi:hypothetical protein